MNRRVSDNIIRTRVLYVFRINANNDDDEKKNTHAAM